MKYAQPSTCPRKWHINSYGTLTYRPSPNLDQKTWPYINQDKKRPCKIVDFAVPADHSRKLKECEKKDKYLDLARELKKQKKILKNMLNPEFFPENDTRKLLGDFVI